MKRLITFISLCLALVFSACDSDDEPNYPDTKLIKGQWQLVEDGNSENPLIYRFTTDGENTWSWGKLVTYKIVSEGDVIYDGYYSWHVSDPANEEDGRPRMMITRLADLDNGDVTEYYNVVRLTPAEMWLEADGEGASDGIRKFIRRDDLPVPSGQPTEPEGLPEEAKFSFKMVQTTPLNNNESPLAAPFDLLTFRIYDHNGGYSYFGPAEFFQYYDSIVVSSPKMPDTYRVYWKESEAGGEEEHFTSQWSSYFYETDDFAIVLKGYKNGEVIYETSETQEMYGRDFLCVDWTDGIVTIANPTNNGVYCILDKRHEFSIVDKQELNGTLYTKLYAKASLDETGNENLEEKKASLQWLLKKHLGAPSSVAVSDFKTLPEGTDVVETYQNKTTRAALLHRPADDFHLETYLAIAEAK